MTSPKPYLLFPGHARQVLTRYHEIFGGELQLNTYGDFGRTDGPADAIAHGVLTGRVELFAADAGPDETSFSSSGLMFTLLGTSTPDELTSWFRQLAEGGTVVDDLAVRPWGATDGQVRDQFGLLWLVGYED